jgi:hypothetical protein
MPDDKELPKVQERHDEDGPDVDRETRLQRRRTPTQRPVIGRSQYSQYEDYIWQAKAAITGV